MERSPVRNKEIMLLLKEALTNQIDDRQVYMKGIDASYGYEGYSTFKANDLWSMEQVFRLLKASSISVGFR